MANGFVTNAHRYDPYKNFKFRILWDGRVVMGVSKCGSLKRTTQVVTYRSGGQNNIEIKAPGHTSYNPISLERGVTHDHEFERWANMIHVYAGDAAKDLVHYKKELTLEVLNERGQVALRYFLHACWVSEFTALPDLDASGNAIAIESMQIQLEGWERDPDTPEPDEGA
jgi:phage tail-like protein